MAGVPANGYLCGYVDALWWKPLSMEAKMELSVEFVLVIGELLIIPAISGGGLWT